MSEESSILVGPVDELELGRPKIVSLGQDDFGVPRQAIVMVAIDGAPRAWLNRCRHLPIPLDAGSGRLMDDDRRHLVCLTHGAVYRVSDGYCIEGPCQGMQLHRVPFRVDEDGQLWLVP